MYKIILAAAIAWLGVTASAWATAITPGSTVAFNTGGEIYVADTGLGVTANLAFTHIYTYDMNLAGGGTVIADVDALNEPPDTGPITFGIANLTFTWETSGSAFISSLTITDGSGFKTVGSLPTAFFTFLANATGYTLTVTGTTLASGGNYSLITSVPLPAAALLFGSALLGGGLMRRRKMIKEFGLPA